jgi:hypothetical protein
MAPFVPQFVDVLLRIDVFPNLSTEPTQFRDTPAGSIDTRSGSEVASYQLDQTQLLTRRQLSNLGLVDGLSIARHGIAFPF